MHTYLENTVLARFLLSEDPKCLWGVARGNNAVRNLTGDDPRSGQITRGRKRDEVAEG